MSVPPFTSPCLSAKGKCSYKHLRVSVPLFTSPCLYGKSLQKLKENALTSTYVCLCLHLPLLCLTGKSLQMKNILTNIHLCTVHDMRLHLIAIPCICLSGTILSSTYMRSEYYIYIYRAVACDVINRSNS